MHSAPDSIIHLMKWIASLLFLLFAVPVFTEHFQENVSVEMVQVYITARDMDHRFITDLRREDFLLQEDGQPQKILDFQNFSNQHGNPQETPQLTVAFSMDISGSMAALATSDKTKIEIAKQAALSLISELQEGDRMAVFGFHSLPKIVVPMTSDTEWIKAKLQEQHPEDRETALYDSLHIMVDQLKKEQGRKIIILGTDGIDTSSHIKLEKLLETLKQSDLTLFAFGMDSMDPAEKDSRYVLNKLADATGGYAFFPKNEKELSDVILQIRKIIRSQYSVWYTPQKSDRSGNWRRIDIACRRGGVELRYRNGYYISGKKGEESEILTTR